MRLLTSTLSFFYSGLCLSFLFSLFPCSVSPILLFRCYALLPLTGSPPPPPPKTAKAATGGVVFSILVKVFALPFHVMSSIFSSHHLFSCYSSFFPARLDLLNPRRPDFLSFAPCPPAQAMTVAA